MNDGKGDHVASNATLFYEGVMMTNEGKKLAGPETDDTELQELGPENLQSVSGGGFFGDALSDLEQGAEDVGHAAATAGKWVKNEAEKHPYVAAGVGAVGIAAVGGVAYLLADAGEDAAADVALKPNGLSFKDNMRDMFDESD
ncbi:hypothetical protein K7H91_21790 [Martelella mediterranea]|uniref:hypothetical protein n=1 Tax=Martelella mediterranea TaxID=293089 RepID=UPI001E3FA0D3|nr:hypothetical protein [Martelella mediterranea]MCD1636395.1 hypothetical protein [Martelella mediterranea]